MPNETLDLFESLARQFAPRFVFHEEERFHPSSVELYLKYAKYVQRNPKIPGVEDPHEFHMQVFPVAEGKLRAYEESKYDYIEYTVPPDEAQAADLAEGTMSTAPVYAHVKSLPIFGKDKDKDGNLKVIGSVGDASYNLIDISYWLFYPYNGPARFNLAEPISLGVNFRNFGTHQADWEHVTVRVLRDSKGAHLMGVYFSQHSSGAWLTLDEFEMTPDGRPVVYVSENGHACWPSPGDHATPGTHSRVKVLGKTAAEWWLSNLTSPQSESNWFDANTERLQIIGVDIDLDKASDSSVQAQHVHFEGPDWVKFKGLWGKKLTEDEKFSMARDDVWHLYPFHGDPASEKILDDIAGAVKEHIDSGPDGPLAKASWKREDPNDKFNKESEIVLGWNVHIPHGVRNARNMDDWLEKVTEFLNSTPIMRHAAQTAKIAISDQNHDNARAVVFYYLGGAMPDNTVPDTWTMLPFKSHSANLEEYSQPMYVDALLKLRKIHEKDPQMAFHTRIEMTNADTHDALLYLWVPGTVPEAGG